MYGSFECSMPDRYMLLEARLFAGLSRDQAAYLCGIHRTTYARQESGQTRISLACYRLILMLGGWLPEPFDGWLIKDGMIWSPENVGFKPGEIRAIPVNAGLISTLQNENRRLEELIAQHREPELPSNVIPFPSRSTK